MDINSFDDFVKCVETGFADHVKNWSNSRVTIDRKKNFKVRTPYHDWTAGENVAEAHHCAAIVHGLLSTKETNIKKIWCAEMHNHNYIPKSIKASTSYSSNLEIEWIPKDPDIAFATSSKESPNWFCQVKFDVQSHVKAVQALGDFFWGAITKLVFSKEKRRDLQYVFVWSEHSSERHDSGGFLKFEKPEGKMELRLSPGFSRGGYGKCKYSKMNTNDPWWDSKNAILTPNNYTTIKQMLAAGTNGTFYRMFHQKGELRIRSEYRQLFVPTSKGEGWNIYVHRLLEPDSYKLLKSESSDSTMEEKILRWIP